MVYHIYIWILWGWHAHFGYDKKKVAVYSILQEDTHRLLDPFGK